jgi:hypothetical protein
MGLRSLCRQGAVRAGLFTTNQSFVDTHVWLHGELNDFLRQHCPVCDERHLAVLAWMVARLLQRWLRNQRVGVEHDV